MLKVQHPTDYLKKEGVDSQANELLSDEMLKQQFTAPGDGSCLFWSIALAYLIPVKDDEQKFSKRYRNLFVDDGDQQVNQNNNTMLGHPPDALEKETEVRNFLQRYNPHYGYPENNSLKELIRRVFRKRVVDYVSSNQERLLGHLLTPSDRQQHIEDMRIDSINIQSWAGESEINAVMERFTIHLDITDRSLDTSKIGVGNNSNVERVRIILSHVNYNHYNYHLDQYIARGYYEELLEDSFRVLKTSSNTPPVPFSRNKIPLTKEDIINIADIEYDWSVGDSSEVIFDVVDTNKLLRECTRNQLDKVKQNKKPLVYIVDLGFSHWVTLVIVYRDDQFFAYYIDPRGEKVADNIKKHLKEENIHCPSIEVKQTDFDTGIFALKNLEVIFKGKRDSQKVILEQRPSFSKKIKENLEKMKLPKNDQGLKDEIDKNGKYKRVDYNNLNDQLNSSCLKLKKDKNGEATFIILSSSIPTAILTVGFRDEQIVACYVANDNTNTDNIKSLLSQEGIVQIFARDDIGTLLPNFNDNIELLILQSAKVVTNYFKSYDYITLAKDELKKEVSEKEIEGVINRLKARNKIEDKIVRCESVIDEYIKKHGTKLTKKDFTVAQSNILILFLESTALEDMELSRHLGERLKRIREKIIGDEDFKVIDIIRSQNLVHRSTEIKNEGAIIKPSEINQFIKGGVSRVEFFRKLKTYLDQIIGKLNRSDIDSANEIKVDSFFKTEDEIKNISYKVKTEEEIISYLSDSFRKLVDTKSCSSMDRQKIMFELVVNIIPLLEGLYRDKKKNKDKKLEIEELRNIQKEKNELHNFYKYKSEIARKLEFKKIIDTMQPIFLKYIYSQKVYDLLQGSTSQLLKDTIEEELKKSLSDLSSEKDIDYDAKFRDESGAINFESIASELEPSRRHEDSLRNFISNYVKLMHLIDNEDKIQERDEKYASLPKRYDQLSGDKRLYIYEYFNCLKELYSKGLSFKSEYKLIEVQFAKELKNNYGILKPSFDSIVDLYVKKRNNINGDQFIERICNDIDIVSRIKGKGKDLKISNIIDYYRTRENLKAEKGSIEEKFKSITEGIRVNINGVDVSTDRFVVNILELFDSIASQYRTVFNNVEEAFNDETFLSILTHRKVIFHKSDLSKLLSIEYIAPYIVELIIKGKIEIQHQEFYEIIERLLKSDLRAVYLKKLLEISDDKLLRILNPSNVSSNRQNIKSELYKQVCERISIDNVSNLYQLLKDEVHAKEILNKLSEIIIRGNASNLDQQGIDLIKSTLGLLDEVSEELIYKKDYKKLQNILGIKEVKDFMNKLDGSNLYTLKIRRRIGVIKNQKDAEYDDAQRILEDIKSKIQLNAQENVKSFFLLVSSDIAYTKHLKEEYKEAYEEYEALYKKMIELSLDQSINDWKKFYLIGKYNKVIKSQKYISILEHHPKYLNILKIRSDMAYELRCFALSKEEESQDEALKNYEDALKIYEEVYKIKETDSLPGQDIVKNIRDIAYVNNKLAKLKLSSSKLSEALSHYGEALEIYSRVLRIQKKELWETHPANSKTIQDIVQAMRKVAYVNNKLGSSKSLNNPREALEHHKKALKIYQRVYEFQRSSLGEEHEYTLKTKKFFAYTDNQLAHLNKQDGALDLAISH
ncbi:hypothetical protein Wxf_03241 [Armadillidium vulgare]|nr:hypothetical protein Wxf_03241 [Armadillidium vulgare] [Wolbachia endosymbiont of Armadillidium vulgare]